MKLLGFLFLRIGKKGTGDLSWGDEHLARGKAQIFGLFEEKTDSYTTLLEFQG